MFPTSAVVKRMMELIGGDSITFAPATQVKVYLVNVAFTPSAEPVIGDLTSPTTGGLGPISGTTTNVTSLDPNNGDVLMEIGVPAGGWNWLTTDTVGLNTTIFGFMVTNAARSVVLASELLPAPVVMTGVGQSLNVPLVGLRLPQGAIS